MEKESNKIETKDLLTVEIYEMIARKLLAIAQDGTVSCPQALALAEQLGVSGRIVGLAANDKGIKISRCQLGCFGVPQGQKHGI